VPIPLLPPRAISLLPSSSSFRTELLQQLLLLLLLLLLLALHVLVPVIDLHGCGLGHLPENRL